MLLVRCACVAVRGVNGTLLMEPGLGWLIRMRVTAVLGEVGDVGGEGSTEGSAGYVMKFVGRARSRMIVNVARRRGGDKERHVQRANLLTDDHVVSNGEEAKK
ncbi:hypothetical protein L210DRAFT_3583231 [Boletus edulis BED1]|uniref:Uncharacterized protein n=1 Tax=Boletus edulis BED1 TaxID=1328754 RepID=A0AAD4BBS3_BOLED|nr:hypothetical protein L210DRAFT_3583231 [Boletus edulis BED1]